MSKEVMRRRACENEYLHKDFHGALSCGLSYLQERYGADAVRDYLRSFTRAFYSPLRRDIQSRGLIALKQHIDQINRIEDAQAQIEFSEDQLTVRMAACPAVQHMRRNNYPVSPLWPETYRTVNEAVCEGSDFEAELSEYDEQTGRNVQRFKRIPKQ